MQHEEHVSQTRSGRLLVIDDNPDISALICAVGRDLGCDTRTACGWDEIRQAVMAFRPDAIVLDLMMPEADGVEVLRYLAEERSNARIIIATGGEPRILDVTTRLAQTLELNLIGALQKPVALPDLERILKQALDMRPRVSAAEFRRALDNGEVVPYYQPKVAVDLPGHVMGAEVLARWQHPEHGLLQPGDFIGVAEETGLIHDLTLMLVTAALEQARSAALTIPLSINLSPLSLDNRGFPDELERRCRSAAFDPSALVFEVTEGVASRDFAEVMSSLARLRLKGFGLSMDDYGTGFSSLVHLVRLPFSEVKIDRSFVSEIGTLRDSEIVVRSTISMARSMGLTVCAEGVETPETAEFLREAECDLLQGYLISRALPGDLFREFLQRRHLCSPAPERK